ncbi:MAG TPA: hypothetical protein VN493_10355 [Thermoanaerobaculia bacterium]|nr:hypothetical protein [Thermoanaerobaculia bacterium]
MALPEGTEVDLLPPDPGDWLDAPDRAFLHRVLVASKDEASRLFDAEEVLKELRVREPARDPLLVTGA